MKYLVLIVPVALLFFAVTNAYAMSFSFNPSTGELYHQMDIRLPAAIVAVTSAAGLFLIFNERKKAKGIWFSDSGRLK
ncbi:MAG TPA: hypothetical protein VNI77_12400 [Nitrososphaera sp.]|nr:hypothetical protein [Nitrososphaera sp.]